MDGGYIVIYVCASGHAPSHLDTLRRIHEHQSMRHPRPFKERNEVFPNAACTTLLARLLHHADATVIEGNRYRVSRRKSLLTKLC